MYICVFAYECTWVQCPQKPDEGIRYPGARVTGSCGLPEVVPGTGPSEEQ